MRLSPKGHHDVLCAFLCQVRAGTRFHQKGFHPWAKVRKKLCKRGPVLGIANSHELRHPSGSFFGLLCFHLLCLHHKPSLTDRRDMRSDQCIVRFGRGVVCGQHIFITRTRPNWIIFQMNYSMGRFRVIQTHLGDVQDYTHHRTEHCT